MDTHTLAQWNDESYLMLVDSRMRDVDVWPSPSEYTITFSSPFDGVFEMALLDATIARTEYIVDDDTNVVRYALGQPSDLADWNSGAWAAGRERVATVEPGDYALPQFIVALNAALSSAAAAGEPVVHASALSVPGEVKNKVVMRCARPFVVLMRESTLRYTLGFGDPVRGGTGSQYGAYSTVPGWSTGRTGGASHVFCSVPSTPRSASDVPVDYDTAFPGSVPAGYRVYTEDVTPGRKVRQYFRSAATGTPRTLSVYVGGASTIDSAAMRLRIFRDDPDGAADGTVVAEGVATLAPGGSVREEFEPRTVALTASGTVVAGVAYAMELSSVTGSYVVYTNEPNVAIPDGARLDIHTTVGPDGPGSGVQVTSFSAARVVCADLWVDVWGNAVVSPGVVNLTGPRYVNIRCPEIESHMFRDRVTEATNAGLGIVKLRGTGFREQRYDFVSFPPRRFHPIDKLGRLSFRLTRPDGTLYDSNGVDHTLLVGIKYRVPPAPTNVPRLLNPEYDPDFASFLGSRLRREAAVNDASRRGLM